MLPKRKKAKIKRDGSRFIVLVDENALFLNKMAFTVYLLCNGENTPENIAKNINTYFKMDNFENVKKEVEQLLETFKKCGLLEGFTLEENPSGNFVPAAPLYITWCITKQCNLYCRHCYLDYGPQEVSHTELMVILEKVKRLQPFFVVLTGGEPLMREELFVILDALNGSEIILETNGTLINAHAAAEIGERCPLVQVSIYSSSEEKHDAMTTVSGSFRKMMEGISLLKDEGVPVQFNCVLHRENINEIEKITDFSLKFGDKIKFDILDLLGRGKNLTDIAFSQSDYKKIVKSVRALQEKFPEKVYIHLPYIYLRNGVYDFDRSVCTASTGLMIDFDGMVKPCEKLPIKVGSVLEDDIIDLWNCTALKAMRDITNIKGRCASCAFLEQCRGGCRGEAYLRTGDLFSEDPLCWIDT